MLDEAIERLRAAGHQVERAEFPPLPLPGLYHVSGLGAGAELTEGQVIDFAFRER